MANWRSNFLSQLLGGDHLKDYQHAARLYTDDLFRLAPKNQFLYHTVFEINPEEVGSSLSSTEKIELGMIVKRCDLPQYSFNVEQKNQYNFKNYIQTGITYQPVTIELHDDMGDVATAFWKSYYQHYIVDTNRQDITYANQSYGQQFALRWGRDVAKHNTFFKSISIFQLARKRFTEYKMMNPIINDWSNGSMAQDAGTGVNSHTFSISYSGVLMENGAVGADPQGFATFHYDKSPSPNRGGGDSIFGLLSGATSTVSLLQSGNVLGAILSGAQTYEKIKSGKAVKGVKEEIIGVVKDAVKGGTNNLGATSKPGLSFPQNLRKKSSTVTIKSNSKTITANNAKPKKFAVKDNEFVLSPQQTKNYITIDANAKLKVAKFITFKNDKKLDINAVDTEWAKLTSAQQQTYLDGAAETAQTLSQQGIIEYAVDQNTYNKVLETQ